MCSLGSTAFSVHLIIWPTWACGSLVFGEPIGGVYGCCWHQLPVWLVYSPYKMHSRKLRLALISEYRISFCSVIKWRYKILIYWLYCGTVAAHMKCVCSQRTHAPPIGWAATHKCVFGHSEYWAKMSSASVYITI